ncbi:MAG: cupin [Nevskia sp.]|nr:cupin [Nevskia sp.]
MSGQDWIAKLGLEIHPEGGYFKRIYTSAISQATATGERPLATSIYYLLDQAEPRGFLHRNRSDILHFFIDGGPVEYLLLDADGELRRVRLGNGAADSRFLLVPGGRWKASQLIEGASHALVAEVVTPGFDYADHQFCSEALLHGEHPQHLETLRPFLPRR